MYQTSLRETLRHDMTRPKVCSEAECGSCSHGLWTQILAPHTPWALTSGRAEPRAPRKRVALGWGYSGYSRELWEIPLASVHPNLMLTCTKSYMASGRNWRHSLISSTMTWVAWGGPRMSGSGHSFLSCPWMTSEKGDVSFFAVLESCEDLYPQICEWHQPCCH